MNLSGTLSKQNQTLSGNISKQNQTLIGMISTIILDHTKLTCRDAPDQHPISAITGLQEYIDALSNGFILYCGSATEVI